MLIIPITEIAEDLHPFFNKISLTFNLSEQLILNVEK